MDISSKVYDGIMFPVEKLKLRKIRSKFIKEVYGDVLEIGAGTGANFGFYDRNIVKKLIVSDLELSEKVKAHKFDQGFPTEKMELSVMKLPFADESFDYVVFTLVFCSVENPMEGLREIKRVLKKDAKIAFIEHILPPGSTEKHLFHKVNSRWSKIAGGCNLNRETVKMIEAVGFEIEEKIYFFKNVFVAGMAKK